MATTENNRESGKSTSNRSTSERTTGTRRGSNKKNSKGASDDTMRFLFVLVIAGLAIGFVIMIQPKKGEQDGQLTPTPTVAVVTEAPIVPETPVPTEVPVSTVTPEPTNTPVPTFTNTPTPKPTNTPTPKPTAKPTSTPKPTPTPIPTPTPLPAPAVSVSEATAVVRGALKSQSYDIQLVNDKLHIGNTMYYQFGIIKNQEFLYPFLVVSQTDGVLSCYDSADGTVFDFTGYLVEQEAEVTPTPAVEDTLTAEEAYRVLCTYSKESLNIVKEVSAYDAEYGNELTLIDGVNCYRINLSEVTGGKVRNRGEFYISVDGEKCYYIDSETNEFILAVK